MQMHLINIFILYEIKIEVADEASDQSIKNDVHILVIHHDL